MSVKLNLNSPPPMGSPAFMTGEQIIALTVTVALGIFMYIYLSAKRSRPVRRPEPLLATHARQLIAQGAPHSGALRSLRLSISSCARTFPPAQHLRFKPQVPAAVVAGRIQALRTVRSLTVSHTALSPAILAALGSKGLQKLDATYSCVKTFRQQASAAHLTALTTLVLTNPKGYYQGSREPFPWSDLTRLEHLQLDDCDLLAPSQLQSLSRLTHLTVTHISSPFCAAHPLPPNLTHLNLKQIKELTAAQLAPVTQLTRLDYLGLRSTYLQDDAVNLAVSLTQLRALDVWGTAISAAGQVQICTTLTTLTHLKMSISDPSSLEQLTCLSSLEEAALDIQIAHPATRLVSLTTLPLQRLHMRVNPLNGQEIDFIRSCTRLRHLEVLSSYCGRGSQLRLLSSLGRLEDLVVACCPLGMPAPGTHFMDFLTHFPRLRRLGLPGWSHNVSDEATGVLKRLTNLEELDLSGTHIGPQTLTRISTLPLLTRLNAQATAIHTSESEMLGALQTLTRIRHLVFSKPASQITPDQTAQLARRLTQLESLAIEPRPNETQLQGISPWTVLNDVVHRSIGHVDPLT